MAVLLVIIHHTFGLSDYPLNRIWYFGWVGVDIFFVLSGFLITGILLDTRLKPNYYRNFIGRRTLRIFPLYYLVLALFFILIPKTEEFRYLIDHQEYFWTYTQNLLFAFQGWPPNSTLNHFWSLAIEEQFYLIWPFLVLWVPTKHIPKIILTGISISVTIRFVYPEMPFAYTFTAARFDTLLIGALLAFGIRHHQLLLKKIAVPGLLLSIAGLLMVVVISRSVSMGNPLIIKFGYLFIALSSGAVLILVFEQGIIGKYLRGILEQRWLLFLGKYSYGIYVYHWIIYNLYYQEILQLVTHDWLALPIYLAVTLIISYGSYHLWEARFLSLKKYF